MRRMLCFVILGLLASSAHAEGALTNQGVVKMVSAGLGEEIVIAKVKEAPNVDFRLEVDDLVSLKQAGLSERVIQAMLDRNRPAPKDPESRIPPGLGMDLIEVSLKTTDHITPLVFSRGDMSTSGFLNYRNMFMNYPGLHARIRTSEKHPVLLVKSSTSLIGGRYYIGKLDSDTKNGVRSLKISSTGQRFKGTFGGGSRGMRAPDPDWTVPFEAIEDSPGYWKVTMKSALEPGEYGW